MQDGKGRFSEVSYELHSLMKTAWAMLYCMWNMAICVADKSLFRDPESILQGATCQCNEIFHLGSRWCFFGECSSVRSTALPVSPKSHANPTEWERGIIQATSTWKKHHGVDLFKVWWLNWGQLWSDCARNRGISFWELSQKWLQDLLQVIGSFTEFIMPVPKHRY